jgi:CubicO group peptidase (beta-lactamase class C family)
VSAASSSSLFVRVLADSLDSGLDLGASVAVSLDGELVVDIWGGFVDEAGSMPWARDTIVNVWSTTKTVSNLCLLVLADRGELDLDASVARYWPEFAAGGKECVLIRHVLGHTAGLSTWEEPIEPDDLYDWQKCTELLARQTPLWEPGTASVYHALTQGYSLERSCGGLLGSRSARSSRTRSQIRWPLTSMSGSQPSNIRE